jgi:hypothetical protein
MPFHLKSEYCAVCTAGTPRKTVNSTNAGRM